MVGMARPMSEELTKEEYEAAREAWYQQCEEVVLSLAASGQAFAFDRVRRAIPEALHPNHYGLLMRRKAVREAVEKIGERPSTIKSRNGGGNHVYRLRRDLPKAA